MAVKPQVPQVRFAEFELERRIKTDLLPDGAPRGHLRIQINQGVSARADDHMGALVFLFHFFPYDPPPVRVDGHSDRIPVYEGFKQA